MSPKIEKRVYLRAGRLTGDTADLPSLAVAANEGLDLWCFFMEQGWVDVAQRLPKNYAIASEDTQHALRRAFDRFSKEMRDLEDAKTTNEVATSHDDAGKARKPRRTA